MKRPGKSLLRAVMVIALLVVCPLDARSSPSAEATGTSAAAEAAAAWPGFRGAHRDGVSQDTGLADAWAESGPKLLWRVAAGPGYSAVSIDADRAFTLWQEDGEQRLVALDASDGTVLWRRTLGPAFSSRYGDGPRATPVLDEGRVFAVDAHGRLAAFRVADGTRIWAHDLHKEFGARIPSIGYASTPLVEDEHLLVEVGAPDGAFMAFDKSTGEVVWASQSDAPAYVSPVALTSGGRRQVVFFSAGGLYALDPSDGRLLWHHPWTAPCPATGIPLAAASPVFIPPDRVFVATAWGENKGGAVLRIVEREGGLAVERVWHAPLIDGQIATAVLVDGHLYGFKGSILVAVEAATGELKWSARGYGRGSVIAADGKLIVLGEQGDLALLEANPHEYRVLAKARLLRDRSWTAPSLADGRLFVRNGEEIVSVDLVDRPAGASRSEE